MSNVLIGIIGVILFIGLALAGALILGDDFRNAGSTTLASTVTSHLQQYSHALTMHNMKTGRQFLTNDAKSALVPRFLKVIPVNPANPAAAYNLGDGNGSYPAGVPVKEIWTVIGPQSDTKARNACVSIEETAGNTNPAATIDVKTNYRARVNSVQRLGCLLDEDNSSYTVYIRV